ncbi:MAG: Smr/MutS family protein [Bacteroidetes bacterium]|nr:Smr/MutS family protein [Bacteroidota bacterium]
MMKKKKKKPDVASGDLGFDPELLRMYMTGAANPANSTKFEFSEDVIDLHLEKLSTGKGRIAPEEALFVQLESFEGLLDKAIAAGRLEMRVVHGLGKGKLKQEIHKILEKHRQVKSFENDYHSRYGFGSTIIYFKF